MITSKFSWSGGASTYSFSIDNFTAVKEREAAISRAIDGTLKSYTKFNKWTFRCGLNHVSPTIESNLETIYLLDTTLTFFPDETVAETYYSVCWANDYEFKTPSYNNLPRFGGVIYSGTIVLHEI